MVKNEHHLRNSANYIQFYLNNLYKNIDKIDKKVITVYQKHRTLLTILVYIMSEACPVSLS